MGRRASWARRRGLERAVVMVEWGESDEPDGGRLCRFWAERLNANAESSVLIVHPVWMICLKSWRSLSTSPPPRGWGRCCGRLSNLGPRHRYSEILSRR
ncbi:hypothetical protein C8034_v000892 [Colletotrichum sidae]|uniref:Uncharacterized protein n=1 Tax=Colletotrichum sidae TaxID=1347389 RepID=A0A4R8TF07_9PEZI|nr:hypothetical protein C8034_v000892 [Colletotrichum sidae]